MRTDQANEPTTSGSPRVAGLIVVIFGCALVGPAWWRWERPREIVDSVPMPRYARLANAVDIDTPTRPAERRRACSFRALAPGDPDDRLSAYGERLEASGWTTRNRSEERAAARYRQGRRLLTLRVRASPERAGWSAIRVSVEPCWPGARDRAEGGRQP